MLPPSSESQFTGTSVDLGEAASSAGRVASRFRILDEAEQDEEEQVADWVDSRAIAFDHANADVGHPAAAPDFSLVLREPSRTPGTGFPLLDDEGRVLEGLEMLPCQARPSFADSSAEFEFPLGPLIWEPEMDEKTQMCLESEPERVAWFSASDIALPAPSPFEREIVVPFPAAAPSFSESTAWCAHPCPAHEPTQPKESVASILESLRHEAVRNGGTLLQTKDDPMTMAASVASTRGVSGEPLSFAEWMLATQQQQPAPSASQHASRAMIDDVPQALLQQGDGEGEERRPPFIQRVAARGQLPPSTQFPDPALMFHRSVAPMAPVCEKGGSEWRLGTHTRTMILAALIFTVAALAVVIWGNGYRSGKESSPPPWAGEAVPAKEKPTASAAANP